MVVGQLADVRLEVGVEVLDHGEHGASRRAFFLHRAAAGAGGFAIGSPGAGGRRQIGVEVQAVDRDVGAERQPGAEREDDPAGHPRGIEPEIEVADLQPLLGGAKLRRQRQLVQPPGGQACRVDLEPAQKSAEIIGDGLDRAGETRLVALGRKDAGEREVRPSGQERRRLVKGQLALGKGGIEFRLADDAAPICHGLDRYVDRGPDTRGQGNRQGRAGVRRLGAARGKCPIPRRAPGAVGNHPRRQPLVEIDPVERKRRVDPGHFPKLDVERP